MSELLASSLSFFDGQDIAGAMDIGFLILFSLGEACAAHGVIHVLILIVSGYRENKDPYRFIKSRYSHVGRIDIWRPRIDFLGGYKELQVMQLSPRNPMSPYEVWIEGYSISMFGKRKIMPREHYIIPRDEPETITNLIFLYFEKRNQH